MQIPPQVCGVKPMSVLHGRNAGGLVDNRIQHTLEVHVFRQFGLQKYVIEIGVLIAEVIAKIIWLVRSLFSG